VLAGALPAALPRVHSSAVACKPSDRGARPAFSRSANTADFVFPRRALPDPSFCVRASSNQRSWERSCSSSCASTVTSFSSRFCGTCALTAARTASCPSPTAAAQRAAAEEIHSWLCMPGQASVCLSHCWGRHGLPFSLPQCILAWAAFAPTLTALAPRYLLAHPVGGWARAWPVPGGIEGQRRGG
jgi:hypothetical protein